MNILTDEEIIFIENTTASRSYNDHARAIEAAVLSKLAKQAGEPLGTANDLIDDYVLGKTNINPNDRLYTETQYLAAQQRTAEACAKLCDDRAGGWVTSVFDTDELRDEDLRISALISNGDWRKYL